MTPKYPLTPPPELLEHWAVEHRVVRQGAMGVEEYIAIQTSRFRQIADDELNACVKWFKDRGYHPEVHRDLRAARRPVPPSLAEQAKAELDGAVMRGDCISTTDAMPTILLALEKLKQLEQEKNGH